MSRAKPDPALIAEVAAFLNYEARLLDEGRFTEWLDLLADDMRYYAPTRDFNFDNNFLDSTRQPPGTPAVRTLIRSTWLNPMANSTNYAGY